MAERGPPPSQNSGASASGPDPTRALPAALRAAPTPPWGSRLFPGKGGICPSRWRRRLLQTFTHHVTSRPVSLASWARQPE